MKIRKSRPIVPEPDVNKMERWLLSDSSPFPHGWGLGPDGTPIEYLEPEPASRARAKPGPKQPVPTFSFNVTVEYRGDRISVGRAKAELIMGLAGRVGAVPGIESIKVG